MKKPKKDKKRNIWLLTPLFGVVIFACLYVLATFFYPGGSQVDSHADGFSWAQNYWCNLLNKHAINGQDNPARPIAVTAMVLLCLSLAVFFYFFPKQVGLRHNRGMVIQVSGTISMFIAMFLFTNLHDLIVNLAGLFGVTATIGTFVGLHQLKWEKLFWFGVFNLILIAVNNILYYDPKLIIYLPVVQKFTFFFFLLWICLIDLNLYSRQPVKKTRQLRKR